MPDWPDLWITLSASAALFGIAAYAILGGADFGGGVWDLFATGERKGVQRLAIQRAMGPVWEANHVWLILVIVVLFTAFPRGYAALSVALFLPFHLALLGIMLRGASFVFRSLESRHFADTGGTSAWGTVFGIASIIAPFLLGAAFGAVTEGEITVQRNGGVQAASGVFWLTPYCIANGFLAVATCAYLAATYLTIETDGPLQEDFRRRAIYSGTATAVLAAVVLAIAAAEATWFLKRLLSWRTAPIIGAGLICFAGSAWSVFTGRARLARMFAAAEVVLLIVGWGMAQYPHFIYPSLTFAQAAGPTPTLKFLVLSLPVGAALIAPSLWLLFRVFKSRYPA